MPSASHHTLFPLLYSLQNIIYFSYGLFNDAVSSTLYVAPTDRMNNELERIWKEAVVA